MGIKSGPLIFALKLEIKLLRHQGQPWTSLSFYLWCLSHLNLKKNDNTRRTTAWCMFVTLLARERERERERESTIKICPHLTSVQNMYRVPNTIRVEEMTTRVASSRLMIPLRTLRGGWHITSLSTGSTPRLQKHNVANKVKNKHGGLDWA